MLTQHRRIGRRIKTGRAKLRHDGRRTIRQPSVDDVVFGGSPRAWAAIPPPGRLGQERQLHLGDTGVEPRDVLPRRQCAAVEQVFVDAIGQQHAILRVPLLVQHAEDAAGTVAVLAARRAAHRAVAGTCAQPAVRVVQVELEAAPLPDRPDAAVFRLRLAEHVQQHVVDVVRDIEVRTNPLVTAAQRLDPFPSQAVAVVRVAGIGPAADVPVAVDRLVIRLRATEIVGQHVGVPALAEVVHPPVVAVQIEVHKPAVRVEVAHLQHRVVGETVGHVKAALHHVVRPGAQIELIELPYWLNAVVEAVEQRITQLAHAVFFAEINPEVFLVEIRPRAAEVTDAGVHLESLRAVRRDELQRPERLRGAVDPPTGRDDHRRQAQQRVAHLRPVRPVLGDPLVHPAARDDLPRKNVRPRLHPRAGLALLERHGPHRRRFADGQWYDVSSSGRPRRLFAVDRVADHRSRRLGAHRQLKRFVAKPVRLAKRHVAGRLADSSAVNNPRALPEPGRFRTVGQAENFLLRQRRGEHREFIHHSGDIRAPHVIRSNRRDAPVGFQPGIVVALMKQLAVDVDCLTIAILEKHEVMPLAQAAAPTPVNARGTAITATRRVPVNLTVAPRDVRLGIALAAGGALGPKPKGGRGTLRMKLLPQRDGKLIKIRSRFQPRVTGGVRPVDAYPFARG